MISGHKRKFDIFDPYNVLLLAIATNTPVRLKSGFVVQCHKCVLEECVHNYHIMIFFNPHKSKQVA